MSSKRRDEQRLKKLTQRLWDHYGDRIALSGRLAPLGEYTRWYCFKCEEYFHQRVHSLYNRGSATRCKCPPRSTSQRFKCGDHNKSNGHMCLPEWDCYDLTPPERPSDPQEGA